MLTGPKPENPGPARDPDQVRKFFDVVRVAFDGKPFKVHPLFKASHSQTLAAHAWPRRRRLRKTVTSDQERLFDVAEGVQVLAQCRWQSDKEKRGTIVLWHGMEGSTSSIYMWSTAEKAFRAGFNVVRVNYRNCGGTDHLTPTLYHGGLSSDLRSVTNELINQDRLKSIFPIGFSLGGNMVLKFAAEYGVNPPSEIVATCAISPSVDLKASSNLIMKRSNWIYHRSFVGSMKARVRLKSRLHPELYDVGKLGKVRTIRDFDELFTAPSNGFEDAEDYYQRASSIATASQIRIPTLIIHSRDDPFIPYEPLGQNAFTQNPYLLLISTKHGGHVAFISEGNAEDRFWAENRAIEFCQLAESKLTTHF